MALVPLLFITTLMVICSALKIEELFEIQEYTFQSNSIGGFPLKHIREKRDALPDSWVYIIDVEVNVSDQTVIQDIKSELNSLSFPVQLENTINVTQINITTVCSPNGIGYQCKCEDQLAWSYNTCLTYTSCGNDYSNYSCGCINGFPPDGESCGYIQPTAPPPQPSTPTATPTTTLNQTFDYTIDIEVNVSDISVVNQLRMLLNTVQFPYMINNMIEIDAVNLTTVCSPNGIGYQCKCEDQLAWSYNTCLTYTSCGNDYSNYSCGCINGFPPDGESCGYIQPTAPPPQPSTPTATPTTTLNQTFDYTIDIEVNVSDISVVNQLRMLLNTVQFPYMINNMIEIDAVNLTTVCSPNGIGYQCKCEDQLAWSYNTCLTYTSCGNDYSNYSCGCINGFPPDGESCGYIQPTAPPPQPSTPTATPTTTLNQTFDYTIDIEVNVSDISVVNQLRMLLNTVQFPYMINNMIEIDAVNLTTVCSPNGIGYQCKCEDQLAWSYNTCLTYTSCGNDYSNYSCGCINGFPPDGESCGYIQPTAPPPQPSTPTATPMTTATPSPSFPTTASPSSPTTEVTTETSTTTHNQTFRYIIAIEVNVSDISVVNQLRILLNSIQFPYMINNMIEIDSVNLTTVCSPNGIGYQCKCEDQLAWSYNTCLTYTSCGNDYSNYSCGCINGFPPDGESCGYIQPTAPPPQPSTPTATPMTTLNQTFDYTIDIEVNVSDISVVNQLRMLLNTVQFPYMINNMIEIDAVNLTTVCSPNGIGYQCKCEDQLAWSYNTCLTYTSCGNDYSNYSCGCINGFPPDGESCGYIQPTAPPPQPSTPTATPMTTTAPPPQPSTPTATPMTTLNQTFDYTIDIEVNVSDISVVNQLRMLLNTVQFPYMINNMIEIDAVNLTTVCSPNGIGYQCKCEDQLAWSYNTCLTYTSCGNDYSNYSCGCINGFPPDGESCGYIQPHNQTFRYIIAIEVNVSDISVVNQLRMLLNTVQFPYMINNMIEIDAVNLTTVCSPNGIGYQCKCEDQLAWSYNTCLTYTSCGNDYSNYSCGCINGFPPDGESCGYIQPTAPPPQPSTPTATPTTTLNQTFDYTIDIEVNVSDISVVNQLRMLLNTVQFPYMINNMIEIDAVNLTTVCSPNGIGYQCKCEDQLAWSYNTCLTYTSCGNDYSNYSCGCINGFPPDGESCGYIQPTAPPPQPSTPTATPMTSSPTTEVTTETSTTTTSPPPQPSTPTLAPRTTTPSPPFRTTASPSSPTTEVTTETSTTSSPTTEISTETTSHTAAPTTQPPETTTTASPTAAPTTQPPETTTTVPATTVIPKFQLEMSFKILDNFTDDLLDPNSKKYIKFKNDIEIALTENYQNLPGFLSVTVTGFRPGSVITEFVVNTNNVSSAAIVAANVQIVKDLKIKDYNLDANSFQALINGTDPFNINPSSVFVGNVMELKCFPPSTTSIQSVTWKFQNTPLQNSGRYTITNQPPTLVVLDVITGDSGVYSCAVMDGLLTYTHYQVVTIQQQPPIINLPLSQINLLCSNQMNIPLYCCVTYSTPTTLQINWQDTSGKQLPSSSDVSTNNNRCITYTFSGTQDNCVNSKFTCQVMNGEQSMTAVAELKFLTGVPTCIGPTYGNGTEGSEAVVGCPLNFEGEITVMCINNKWKLIADNCVLSVIKAIQLESQNLTTLMVPGIAMHLANAAQSNQEQIQGSPATIATVVGILNSIAGVSKNVTKDVMQNVLETVNILVDQNTSTAWSTLNNNTENKNTSARLLGSMETISGSLAQEYISINKANLNLQKTLFTQNFSADLNSSQILIPDTGSPNVTAVTTIVFTTMYFVLPARNSSESANTTNSTNVINGIVMLVKSDAVVENVSISFDKRNTSLGNPQCVFWNFTLFGEAGGWDSSGCTVQYVKNDSITCSCNHLTSFSILMSPYIPEAIRILLDFITYIGVSISLLSLVLCLIIEAFVWTVVTKNSTSYMRHVSIVNIAVSLLMADIWFMVGAGVSDIGHTTPVGSCTAATFFTHFFYLALFFWMLISALLLLYRMIMVFSDMSKCTMMSIAFTVGYGAPLIIAVITIAVTAPQHGYFRQDNACWLNWYQTKALLAFVIPALTIVAINLLILLVVLVKILMRGVGENRQPDEKNALMVVARCVVILTPLFGLTWGFGIGTMVAPESVGFHVVFAVLNSFQGLFVLIFGTLLDSRVRAAIVGRFSFVHTLSGRTRTSSGGASSSSRFSRFRRERRNAYNVSEVAASSQSGASESFINI